MAAAAAKCHQNPGAITVIKGGGKASHGPSTAQVRKDGWGRQEVKGTEVNAGNEQETTETRICKRVKRSYVYWNRGV